VRHTVLAIALVWGKVALPNALALTHVKYYRWAILTVMSVTLGVQTGVRVAFSVFYVALRQEFGWSAAATAGVFSLYMGVLAVSSPLVGWWLDRYGARLVLTLAALLVGVSLWGCSAIHTLWEFYLVYGLLLALGQTGLSSGATSVVLARWFPEMRGRAIALADIGTALGTALYSPWSQWLIETYGWRSAFVWLGSSVMVLLVPLNCWQRSVPPTSGTPAAAHAGAAQAMMDSQTSWTLAQVLRSVPFWMLFSALFFASIGQQVVSVHLVALLVSIGVTAMAAATVGGLVNFVSLGGRLGCGWLTDRLSGETAYTAAMLCSIAGMGVLLGLTPANATWLLVVFVAIAGLGKGSSGIAIPAKAVEMFHGERLGTILGLINTASGLGGAIGPWWGGWIVDRTGSYQTVLLCSIATAGLAIACIWLVEWRPRITHASGRGA
jgi:MFS family permease